MVFIAACSGEFGIIDGDGEHAEISVKMVKKNTFITLGTETLRASTDTG
jgi:hypothetical protein